MRLRLPPLVGYLIAGALVGPHTPGFVADAELATELSEIGVILLMFGVGLHFSLKDLLSVRAVAIPGAVVQIGGATLMGAGLGQIERQSDRLASLDNAMYCLSLDTTCLSARMSNADPASSGSPHPSSATQWAARSMHS